MYVHVPYPAVRYHVDGRVQRVEHAAADQALGDGWYDSPAAARTAAQSLADAAALLTLAPDVTPMPDVEMPEPPPAPRPRRKR
jgi:hypothetical protein